jgi:riboflavin kinase/FMN adenylyltransferase
MRVRIFRENFAAKVHGIVDCSQPNFVDVKIHQNVQSFRAELPVVLTIGTFDGVHAGHRSVLRRVKERAQERGAETVLLTFDPHPRTVLHTEHHGLRLLNTSGEKAALLEGAGLDHLVVHPFTRELARMSPKDYVRDLFAEGIRPEVVIVGYDHRFGRNREGSFESLENLGRLHGFEVEELPAHYEEETRVSSTKVREALLAGEVEAAANWLCAPYPFTGRVVRGEGKGQTWGFPTANLVPDLALKAVPADGVYACWAYVEDDPVARRAMVNIGRRPTVSDAGTRSIEAHLLDVDRDLYGSVLQLHFMARLRSERRFDGAHELVAQLRKDRETAERGLAPTSAPVALFNPAFPA